MNRYLHHFSDMFLVPYIWSALILPCAWAQNNMPSVVVEARNITVPAGSDVLLPCNNQRMVWRQDRLRDRQRVVHWDLIRNQPDYTVERILDMFSGGTERLYSDYNRGRITISKDAFSDGNFSLVINNVDVNDKGIYTCNLHHHYCKVHQSIRIQLNVTKSHTNMVEAPRILNVILPENQTHLLHQVGYILAIFLLLLLMLIGIIITTRHCRKKGPEFEVRRSERGRRTSIELDATELQPYNQEDLRLDYKNNIIKERAAANNYPSPEVIDLNRETERMSWK
ncbi:matrix-remodeling-associated protein 8-like [Sinocyclocheilus grahami]|uniref:matrix-remodeling-associated protein 8-like n=1 Tax=Sinocyclocheilus grahami TaxID=75366 RepID=UPI0007AC8448|nr:PREDICTED: matrix-remodeling-associated protein 8-like [Sinocyclocheilus grahami]